MSSWMQSTFLALTLLSGGCALADEAVDTWNTDLDVFLDVLNAEHDNPYFHTSREIFEAEVAAYRASLPDLTREKRIAGFARIVALVGDGHTWMPMYRMPFDGLPSGPGFRSLPVRFELFDDGLFVVGATPAYESLLGQRVERIGTASADEAVARAMTLLPQDAVNFAREFVAEWLMQAELLVALDLTATADAVAISAGGQMVTVEPLSADFQYDWIFNMDTGPSGLAWQTAPAEVPLWRETIPGNLRHVALDEAVYFQINQIHDGEMSLEEASEAAIAEAVAMESPALVIDLRRCLGGDGTLNAGLIAALEAHADELDGRIAVLTSRQTHSAAVMLVSALEQNTSARFYGQATADRPNHYGETNIFVTPNSLLPIIHASEYYQTSSPDDDRLNRQPDVPVPYRFSDYVRGDDPVLARALEDFTE